MDLKQIEKISKALSDVNRLKIVRAIQSCEGKLECSTITASLDLSQPSVSHHIKKLVDAELIVPQKEGRFYFYSLNKELMDNYLKTLQKL